MDENIPLDQRELLKAGKIRFRFMGQEIGSFGVKDENILTMLHHLKTPTFFTRDEDFFARELCHPSYCLVWINAKKPLNSFAYFSATRGLLQTPGEWVLSLASTTAVSSFGNGTVRDCSVSIGRRGSK